MTFIRRSRQRLEHIRVVHSVTMLGTLSDFEVQQILKSASIGRIAWRSADDILILPISFRYYDGCAYCHSFEGTKIEWMRELHHVGFEVDDIEDHQNWRVVTAQGIFEELTSPVDIDTARFVLRTSWQGDKSSLTAPSPAEIPAGPHKLRGASVFFRIRLFQVSGRFEHGAAQRLK